MTAGFDPHQRYFFDVNGYLVIDDVLTPAEVAALEAVIDRKRLPPPGESIASQRFEDDFLTWDRGLRALMDHPRVLPLLRELLGGQLRLDHAYGIVMAPGTSGLGLHGGGTPFDPAQYYAHRDGRPCSGLTTVMWSLVGSRPGEGGFGCIPGSHKANEALPAEVPAEWVEEVALAAGSVLIFTEALTHGTLRWTAPARRCSVLFKYSPGPLSWGRWQEPPARLWRQLSDQQRRLLQPPAVHPHDAV